MVEIAALLLHLEAYDGDCFVTQTVPRNDRKICWVSRRTLNPTYANWPFISPWWRLLPSYCI